uniref:Uncharacterized protein n=1 Tax=Mustela putorius furo TaxID=9669 RepID=M3Y842_MUSPF
MEATWQREDRKLQKLLTHIESKRQQVDAAFGKLQRELADQHSLLQARLRELELQTCMERDQYNSKFSEEITRLGAQELEEQSQQPASVLLQVRPCPPRGLGEGLTRRGHRRRARDAGTGGKGKWPLVRLEGTARSRVAPRVCRPRELTDCRPREAG